MQTKAIILALALTAKASADSSYSSYSSYGNGFSMECQKALGPFVFDEDHLTDDGCFLTEDACGELGALVADEDDCTAEDKAIFEYVINNDCHDITLDDDCSDHSDHDHSSSYSSYGNGWSMECEKALIPYFFDEDHQTDDGCFLTEDACGELEDVVNNEDDCTADDKAYFGVVIDNDCQWLSFGENCDWGDHPLASDHSDHDHSEDGASDHSDHDHSEDGADKEDKDGADKEEADKEDTDDEDGAAAGALAALTVVAALALL
jgi:hypothetical protein